MKEKLENMPILVFLLLGVAFAGYNYMGSLSTVENLQTQIAQLNTQILEKNNELKKAENITSEVETMKEEISQISQSLSRATELIPNSNSPREILTAISKEAKDAGIRVTQSRPEDVVQSNYYDEMPLSVEFEGSYTQLTYFMYLLSKQKLIVHSRDMDLTLKEIIDGQTSLKMSGKLVGFRYKESKQ